MLSVIIFFTFLEDNVCILIYLVQIQLFWAFTKRVSISLLFEIRHENIYFSKFLPFNVSAFVALLTLVLLQRIFHEFFHSFNWLMVKYPLCTFEYRLTNALHVNDFFLSLYIDSVIVTTL